MARGGRLGSEGHAREPVGADQAAEGSGAGRRGREAESEKEGLSGPGLSGPSEKKTNRFSEGRLAGESHDPWSSGSGARRSRRYAVFKCENEDPLDVLRWVDRMLIRLVTRKPAESHFDSISVTWGNSFEGRYPF